MNENLAYLVYRIAAYTRSEPTFKYLEQYNKTQYWTKEKLKEFQQKKLEELISYANHKIPYYKELGISEFEKLPIINKLEIKQSPEKFINKKLLKSATKKTTGGSTGEPVTIYKDHEELAREQAGTLRGYSWAGINPGDRQARLWGVPLNIKAKFHFKLKDILLNKKRFSAYNYTEETIQKYLKGIEQFNPSYFYGYVSLIEHFAKYVLATNYEPKIPKLKAIITTSEILTPETRQIIQNAFQTRVFNEYGCGELGTIAHESKEGNLHINSENLLVETLDENNNPITGKPGRVVITDLHNKVQPLIRYNLADYAVLTEKESPDGIKLPIIENVLGRGFDIIRGPNGRHYYAQFFIAIFEDINAKKEVIEKCQVVQHDKRLDLNIIKAKNYTDKTEEQIRARLTAEFADYFELKLNYLEQIPSEKSGKVRIVKRVSPAEI